MTPSVCAILVPTAESTEGDDLLDRALARQGLIPWSPPRPNGYRTRQDEWHQLAVTSAPCPGHTLLIPADIGAVFGLALWLSQAVGAAPVLALRRDMGLPPVMKVLLDGQPRWRDGSDDDHEVR